MHRRPERGKHFNHFFDMKIEGQKLTASQKKAKKEAKLERQNKYMWVFVNGKQTRVKKPPMIDGIPQDEWMKNNDDAIWLHQNEMWEVLDARVSQETGKNEQPTKMQLPLN